jgi:hypothetical protein
MEHAGNAAKKRRAAELYAEGAVAEVEEERQRLHQRQRQHRLQLLRLLTTGDGQTEGRQQKRHHSDLVWQRVGRLATAPPAHPQGVSPEPPYARRL